MASLAYASPLPSSNVTARNPNQYVTMNLIRLQPTDILFFRDGRPMGGSSAGHGEAWPLPTMTDAALHAALHRSGLQGHNHDQKLRGESAKSDVRSYGSLTQAGPFPVSPNETWLFPRPLDLLDQTTVPSLLPLNIEGLGTNSLPQPLKYTTANTLAPSKDRAAPKWISAEAMDAYLNGSPLATVGDHGCGDNGFSDTEHAVGIGIDPNTNTTGSGEAKGQIYSAHYLRLREGWRLGVVAETNEKIKDDRSRRDDLIPQLFGECDAVLVGGQQRRCTAHLDTNAKNPLPYFQLETSQLRPLPNGLYGVKWTLLSPAIFPSTKGHAERGGTDHSGGWLPNWVNPIDGQVMLKTGDTTRQQGERRDKWRERIRAMPNVPAFLVSAITGKPLPVTGWALSQQAADRSEGGAKPTALAVPAGSVYYFETESAESAVELANTLSWHGPLESQEAPKSIVNRRSTSLGEKGFGLGVCSAWKNFPSES